MRTKKPQISRLVRVWIEGRFAPLGTKGKLAWKTTWSECEKILQKAVADGVIDQFVCKPYTDSDIVWFTGTPGKKLRELKAAIESRFEKGFSNVQR